MNVPSWPLLWPPGWTRTKYRSRAPFRSGGGRLTIAEALRRLLPELDRLGADDVTVSTNVKPHLYTQMGDTQDPGAAVYFLLRPKTQVLSGGGTPTVLACDRWDRTADNLAAIAAHVEAVRGQERWGVGTIAQALAGYQALPAMPSHDAWWTVLELPPTADVETIKRRRVELLTKLHPDRPGGDGEKAAEINRACAEALKEKSAS